MVYSPSIWAGLESRCLYGLSENVRKRWESKTFFACRVGRDSHAGRHAEATAPIRKEGESDGDAALNGSALVLKKGMVGKLYCETDRLASEGTGNNAVADRCRLLAV